MSNETIQLLIVLGFFSICAICVTIMYIFRHRGD